MPGQIVTPPSHDVNLLGINQMATVLNSIVQQATGQKVMTPTNTSEFISVANTALLAGYDPLLKAISQVLTYTIFSVRPYYAKFRGLMRDRYEYGNHVRKLQMIDSDWEMDNRFEFENGDSVDMYKIKKPDVLQTNFYGQNVFKRHITIFRDQLNVAFRSPEEFGRFISMVMQNIADMIEQANEMTARYVINNFIGGKIAGDSDSVIHLLTEYNAETGLNLNQQTVNIPENFADFIRWFYARVETLSDWLTDRSIRWHTNVEGKPISRHTPYARQRLFAYSNMINKIGSSVLSTTYNDNLLKMSVNERVNYWQSPQNPDQINITPVYMNPADGDIIVADSAVEQSNIFGVLLDEEAAGITQVNQWSASTPFNADGGYSNIFWHFTNRYWNDFTENGIVLLLD